MDTALRTVSVPTVPTEQPSTLNPANNTEYVRAAIANVGLTNVLLATDSVSLQNVLTAPNAILLPAGDSVVIPLAPRQQLYGVSVGAVGTIRLVLSVAIPFRFMES